MTDFLRTLCVVSCLMAGIYNIIICYYFRDSKRSPWFSLLCVSFAFHMNMDFMVYPYLVFDPSSCNGISVKLFLSSYALVVLCMNCYSGAVIEKESLKYHIAFNSLLVLLSAVAILIPDGLVTAFYIIIVIFSLLSCIFGINTSIKETRSGDSLALIPAIVVTLLGCFTVVDVVFGALHVNFFSLRCLYVPLIVLSQNTLMTIRYHRSISKTKRLSQSLQETLEKIRHSDNALMCTQMKSDFLYRSLDLITQKCDEDPFTAEDLTISLSKYLRHTLNFQQLTGVVPLSNEIELTKSYIAIEKERYPEITFEYHFPSPMPEFHIPPLSIQPLVENAIEHGLAKKGPGAKLTITIMPYRESYQIDVSDNGAGMDEALASTLTEQLHDSARIGVYNIHSRLVSLFGRGLVIQSVPGIGTSVTFIVPPDAASFSAGKENV